MAFFRAFKEWQAIVGSLAAGEQILILRKGGIAEGRGGFAVTAKRFWLFPTAFHAQRDKTKASAHRHFQSPAGTPSNTVSLSYYADVVAASFLSDWPAVARLDPFHAWTEQTVQERFDWAKPPGLHALVVRVYRIPAPVEIELTPEMAGCKSWLEVPLAFDAQLASPVLDDATFDERRRALAL